MRLGTFMMPLSDDDCQAGQAQQAHQARLNRKALKALAPGQESRNSDFLLENGAAIKVNNVATLAYKLTTLLRQPDRLKQLKANARRLGLHLTILPETVRLTIEDDGRGFDPMQIPKGRFLLCPRGSHLAMYDDQATYIDGLLRFMADVDVGR